MSLELGPAAVSQRKLHHETPSHPASGAVSERFTPAPGIPGGSGGSFTWRTYIMADGHLVAARFVT